MYVDLEPNFYFWDAINQLERDGNFDPIVKREQDMVTYIDDQIQERFGIEEGVMDLAEYGKNIKGGFREDQLLELFTKTGFSSVRVFYQWYIGQGFLINNELIPLEKRFEYAGVTEEILQKVMPLSRNLFKYVGVIATK